MRLFKLRKNMIRKIIIALWILFAVVVVAVATIFISISEGWIGYMPPVEELENPNYKFATEIFSEDGKVMGTFSVEKIIVCIAAILTCHRISSMH